MASDYARALGARLRAIRTQQGLSLHGVEEKSEGHWKAVVVGSYERGDRAVTVQRLAELADFYGVPVQALLRLSIWELLWNDEVPDAVAIDEAVELAHALSTDESPAFVNGLLARLLAVKPTVTR